MATYRRSVVSRDTRLLLITIAVSVAALWLLARVRFQERPATATPVPPMLAQLRPQSSFGDLAGSLSDLRARLAAATTLAEGGVLALRTGGDTAIVLAPVGLRLVPVTPAVAPALSAWTPRVVDYPRYLIAADSFGGGVSLRPVFVGSMVPLVSPIWSDTIWQLPPGVDLSAGTIVFTTDGQLAGLAIEHAGGRAMLPGAAVLNAAAQLRVEEPRAAGYLGIAVQEMPFGLVISWVDPDGPAAGRLVATEVIEAVNGQRMRTVEHWRAHLGRLSAGDTLDLRIRSHDKDRDVTIAVVPARQPPAIHTLGLTLRAVGDGGAAVVAVQPSTSGARAGIRVGDLIVAADGQTAPTPAQVQRAFAASAAGASLLVALKRGDDHRVVVLEK